MYAICEFSNSKNRELAVVPVTWLSQNNTKCAWPRGKQERLHKLIKEKSVPKKSWPIYNTKVLNLSTDYDEAEKNLDQYIKQSCQESEDSGNTMILIKRKNDGSNQSSSTSEDEDNDAHVGASLPTTPSSSSTWSVGSNEDYFKQILLQLNEVSAQQEQQSMMLNEILRAHRVNTHSTDLQRPKNLPEMPLKTQDEMVKLNTLLDDIDVRTYMTNRLSAIGGVTVETLTRRILKYVISNELAALYNWKGRDKNSFEKTTLKIVIFDAVKKSFPQGEGDDLKIANTIKDWLKFAKVRMTSKR